jgi:hypothetical protein
MSHQPLVDIEAQAVATQLEACERIIRQGMETFVLVGEALAKIRDQQLYRERHPTFEDYVRVRWGFTSSRARQLIGASKTAAAVAGVGGESPVNEGQARALGGLAPEDAAEVMRRAIAEAGTHVTAAVIKEIRARFRDQTIHTDNNQEDDDDPTDIRPMEQFPDIAAELRTLAENFERLYEIPVVDTPETMQAHVRGLVSQALTTLRNIRATLK